MHAYSELQTSLLYTSQKLLSVNYKNKNFFVLFFRSEMNNVFTEPMTLNKYRNKQKDTSANVQYAVFMKCIQTIFALLQICVQNALQLKQ